jgi:hypothetical protein
VLRIALALEKPTEFLAKAGAVGEIPAALIEKAKVVKTAGAVKH